MRNAPTNRDDMIDSRDIIERIEELEGEREALTDAHAEALDAIAEHGTPNDNGTDKDFDTLQEALENAAEALVDWDNDNGAELAALQSLASQAEGYVDDWRHGATLIRDSYFETYAQELADDIGAIDRNAKWPQTCIDWREAAEELQADYTAVKFDGVTYWVR